ncbi:MAG: tyrosine-type recombinase/integrase [bacterium]|nr:tyrosine-type recombinase/integrase [bacterium]
MWYVDYYHKGKRRTRAISKSKRIAELVLKDIEVKIAKEEHLGIQETGKTLFSSFAEKYLDYSKANKMPLSSRRDIINLKHLTDYFKNYYLHELKPEIIEKYKAERLEKVEPASVNRELATLKHLYTKAIEWGYNIENPAKRVKLLREPSGRIRYLEKDEIKRLLDTCASHIKPIVVVALNTGMRRGEILNLKWQDISLKNRTIAIRNSKSHEARTLPMNDDVFDALKKIPKNGEFVFMWNGNKIADIKNAFNNAVKRANIKNFHFHDLRHTFASYLAMDGFNLMTIQKLLGHKDIKMTMRYSHLSESNLKDAVQRLVTIW